MGVNAQTAVPAFVAGEVLTAAEMTQVNTGIPVFATTTTRDDAFGGAGEKVLAQGQYCYIEATSMLQTYTGSAWLNVPSPGFTQVLGETSFSAVTSVTRDNVFTSAYTNYLIMINVTGSTGENLYYQLRAGGVTTSANYGNQYINASGTSLTTTRSTANSAGYIGTVRSTAQTALPVYMFAPQLAQWTSSQVSYLDPVTSTTFGAATFWATQHTTTQYDGLVFGTLSAVTITGTYSIYGMNK